MGCGASNISESEAAILSIGELLHDAENAGSKQHNHHKALEYVRKAHTMLPKLSEEDTDHYTILVFSREGKLYLKIKDMAHAIQSYTRAIEIAEVKIAERCRGLYLMLQRYSECMVDIAHIWLESAGKSNSEKRRRKDHAKAEIVLLRCIETIEEGHNRRSDLLVEPLMMLSDLYESLELYGRAEMLVRRCIGILIVQFGHDHPQLAGTNEKLELLIDMKENAMYLIAATRIQSVWKMYAEMKRHANKYDRPLKRHVLQAPRDRTPTPPNDFLAMLAKEDQDEAGMSPLSSSPTCSGKDPAAASSSPATVAACPKGGSDDDGGFSGVGPSTTATTQQSSSSGGSSGETAPKRQGTDLSLEEGKGSKSFSSAAKSVASLKGLMEPILSTQEVQSTRVWSVPTGEDGDEEDTDDLAFA